MGSFAAAAKSALTPQKVLANMKLGAGCFKGTRSMKSITFVIMQADLGKEKKKKNLKIKVQCIHLDCLNP